MRPAFIGGIVIGLLMVVTGIYGASILSAVGLDIGGSYFRDDFTSISGWATSTGAVLATSDGNCAVFAPTTVRVVMQRAITTGETVGAEMKFKISTAGTPGVALIVFWLIPSAKAMAIQIKDNAVEYYNSASGSLGSQSKTHAIGTDYVLTMNGVYSTGKYSVWEGSTLIIADTPMLTGFTPGAGQTLQVSTPTGSGGKVLVDYINIGTSGGPAGGSPNPPKVQVVVKNSDGSGASGKTVVVSKSGTEIQRGLTASNGSYPSDGSYMTLTSGGTYKFYVDDNCYTERSFADNDVVTITLTLGGGGDQGGNPIRDLLNDPTVKMILMYGGGALAGLSCIGLVIPKGKRNGYYGPPQR